MFIYFTHKWLIAQVQVGSRVGGGGENHKQWREFRYKPAQKALSVHSKMVQVALLHALWYFGIY